MSNRNTEIPALPINKTQKRLYAASSDPTFDHETFESMQEYLNNPTALIVEPAVKSIFVIAVLLISSAFGTASESDMKN